MGDKTEIFRVSLQLSDVDRGKYETLEFRLGRHSSETNERLVTRILAYALLYEDDLEFTRGVCAGDEPDLWRLQEPLILQWIETGLPGPDRLKLAQKRADEVVIVTTGTRYRNWVADLPKMDLFPMLTVVDPGQTLIVDLGGSLTRTLSWSVTRMENRLYIDDGNKQYETELNYLYGENSRTQ